MKKIICVFLLLIFSSSIDAQWQQTKGPNGGSCKAIHSFNGYLFAGSNGAGVFRSSDNGNSWSNVLAFSDSKYVESITSQGQYIFVATRGVYRSSDNGNSWIQVNNGFPFNPYPVSTIVSSGQYLICGSYRMYHSSNYGASWDSCTNGLPTSLYTYRLTSIGTKVYAATSKGAYVSTNCGSDWTSINNGINTSIVEIIGSDSINLYAGTSNGVYKSTNEGTSWFLINNGIPVDYYFDIIFDGVYLYTTTLHGMYRTSNCGLNWESCNNGLVSLAVIEYHLFGNRLFCGSYGGAGIQYTTNHGSSWKISNNGFHNFFTRSLASKDNLIFTCSSSQGLAVTSNGGLSWQPVYNDIIDRNIYCVAANNSCIFLSSWIKGMCRSTNNGLNWHQCNTGILDSNNYKEIYAFDDVVFISSEDGSYRSTNNGESWTEFYVPYQIESLARIGNVIIAGNSNDFMGGLIRSTNKGANWTNYSQYRPIGIVAKDSVFYFFKDYDSLYKSTDLGLSWSSFFSNLQNVFGKMYVVDDKLVLNSNLGVFTSSNNGVDWIDRSQGLPYSNQLLPFSLMAKDDYVYMGVDFQGVWKREKSDLLSVKTISTEIPSSFLLHQNYPNPFNPKTNIRFDIPKSSYVKLIIYDALGREVAALVNEKLSAGSYETEWSGNNYPSGVYFYKLITKSFKETKRMVLLK